MAALQFEPTTINILIRSHYKKIQTLQCCILPTLAQLQSRPMKMKNG